MSQIMQLCFGTTSWLRFAIRSTRSRIAVTLTCSQSWVMTGHMCSTKGYKWVWPSYPSFGHFSKEIIYKIINYNLVTCFSYPPPRWDFFGHPKKKHMISWQVEVSRQTWPYTARISMFFFQPPIWSQPWKKWIIPWFHRIATCTPNFIHAASLPCYRTGLAAEVNIFVCHWRLRSKGFQEPTPSPGKPLLQPSYVGTSQSSSSPACHSFHQASSSSVHRVSSAWVSSAALAAASLAFLSFSNFAFAAFSAFFFSP